jgi:heme-degrading monooxygenase HmoA
MIRIRLGITLCFLLAACSEDSSDGAGSGLQGDGDSGVPAEGPCARSKVEEDLLAIPVKPIDGDAGAVAVAPAGGFVVSSTYLRLRPGDAGAARFSELMVPIQGVLMTQPGLLGLELALSEACGTARTLSVWESIDAMYEFSTGEAHMQAVRNVSDVSRGGSLVAHWDGTTIEDATWEEAARQLGLRDGPYY